MRYKNIEIAFENNMKPRNTYCPEPFHYISIGYDGSILPCCMLRVDSTKHKEYILGNVYKQNLVDIFYGKKATKFRKAVAQNHIDNTKYPEPCRFCHKDSYSFYPTKTN